MKIICYLHDPDLLSALEWWRSYKNLWKYLENVFIKNAINHWCLSIEWKNLVVYLLMIIIAYTELDSNNFQNKLHIEIIKNEDIQL